MAQVVGIALVAPALGQKDDAVRRSSFSGCVIKSWQRVSSRREANWPSRPSRCMISRMTTALHLPVRRSGRAGLNPVVSLNSCQKSSPSARHCQAMKGAPSAQRPANRSRKPAAVMSFAVSGAIAV